MVKGVVSATTLSHSWGLLVAQFAHLENTPTTMKTPGSVLPRNTPLSTGEGPTILCIYMSTRYLPPWKVPFVRKLTSPLTPRCGVRLDLHRPTSRRSLIRHRRMPLNMVRQSLLWSLKRQPIVVRPIFVVWYTLPSAMEVNFPLVTSRFVYLTTPLLALCLLTWCLPPRPLPTVTFPLQPTLEYLCGKGYCYCCYDKYGNEAGSNYGKRSFSDTHVLHVADSKVYGTDTGETSKYRGYTFHRCCYVR